MNWIEAVILLELNIHFNEDIMLPCIPDTWIAKQPALICVLHIIKTYCFCTAEYHISRFTASTAIFCQLLWIWLKQKEQQLEVHDRSRRTFL